MSGSISVRKNLCARGIEGDICCVRCGVSDESINHVLFFECPPALQVWRYQRTHQIQLFFHLVPYLQIWITFSGEFFRKWMIISLHRYYGTFGKEEIIKYLVIWTWIPGKHLNWRKPNQHFKRRHM